jgi:hypothetical protein
MEEFIKHFVRERPGVWVCVAPATWEGPPRVQVTPGTKFTVGTPFMGVDLAQRLEQHYRRFFGPTEDQHV